MEIFILIYFAFLEWIDRNITGGIIGWSAAEDTQEDEEADYEGHDENSGTLCNKFAESKKLTLNGQHQVEVNLSYLSERIAPCKPFTLLKQTIRKFYHLIISPVLRSHFFTRF